MLSLQTPRGLPVEVPEHDAEDPSPKFASAEMEGACAYYKDNGYVVLRGVLSAQVCDTVRSLWDEEVKPSRGFIYRQATAKAERHVFNDKGWVMNPILNLQSMDPRRFPRLRAFAVEQVLTNANLAGAFRQILNDRPKIVQSMYFEGNSATWEHQDTYYLDSAEIGTMCAAWIAIERIDAGAGRFFVCPGSHHIRMNAHGLSNNIADNHDAYIESVVEVIKQKSLVIRAPALDKGDVLIWNSRTIHGSLNSQSEEFARSSITCHAIPASHEFLQMQTRRMNVPTMEVNGVDVFAPKDQKRFKNRAVLRVESNFPKPFYYLKRWAIRRAMQRNVSRPV